LLVIRHSGGCQFRLASTIADSAVHLLATDQRRRNVRRCHLRDLLTIRLLSGALISAS
jgi:hypothetical protein